MNDDLVERLRCDWSKAAASRHFDEDILLDAADEIERLREHSRLRGLDIIELGRMVGESEVEIERLLQIINRGPTPKECLAALVARDEALRIDANDQIGAVSYAVEAAFRMRAKQ